MTLVKWKRPIDNGHTGSELFLNSPFSNLFESFFNDDYFSKERASFVPAINVLEENDKFLIEVSAPGFEKENIKVELDKNILSITGTHKIENESEDSKLNYKRKEFSFGSFQRSFALPENIDENKISAKYENGVLKISVLKKEKSKENSAKQILIS